MNNPYIASCRTSTTIDIDLDVLDVALSIETPIDIDLYVLDVIF